jgi:hypothetical protein
MNREIMLKTFSLLTAYREFTGDSRIANMCSEVIDAIDAGLAKPNQFFPDWDMLKPFHERIKELEAQLAQPEQEPVAWVDLHPDGEVEILSYQRGVELDLKWTPLYTAPPRKPWVGLTNEDWENTPDTGKVGCERDAELFDWVEQTLKDKNDTL